MLYLRADTITEVTVGPAVAVGDGFTPVTTLSIASADEAELIKHGATTATAISGTLATITNADGYYALDLSATDTNTEGRLVLLINDDSLILPIRHEFMVVNANVYDSLFAASGTDTLDVQVTGIGANVITAASINSAALTAAKFGSAAITSTVLADNAITAAKINSGAITAAKFGAGAIDAAALATDAVDEIRDGLLPTQNAAFNNIQFLFVAASDNVTPVTAASGMAVTRSIDGAAFAAGTGTGPAEIGNGIYQYDASAADMNGGVITFRFTGTGGTPGAPADRFLTIVTGGGV